MLAEILASNKSALCPITSLAFSFVLIPTLSLDYVRHSNADMCVLRIIIVLAWSLYGPPLYVFLIKEGKKRFIAGYLSICHSEAARETGVISCPENRKNGKALGTRLYGTVFTSGFQRSLV